MPGAGEDRPDAERAEHGADDLRGPVGRDLAPREALRRRERERHGRVDVTARDLAERVDERGDDQAERERDAEQVGAGDGRRAVAREHERRDHRAGSDEHQQRGAQDLSQCTLGEGVALHLLLLRDVDLIAIRQCRMRFATYSPAAGKSRDSRGQRGVAGGREDLAATTCAASGRASGARRPAISASRRGSPSSASTSARSRCGRQLGVGEDRGGAGVGHPARVGGLVVGGGVRIRDQHRRQAVLGELEDASRRRGRPRGRRRRARSRTGSTYSRRW